MALRLNTGVLLGVELIILGHLGFCSWLNIVRTVSVNVNNKNETRAPIHKRSFNLEECRKDRHCSEQQFCNRYLNSCETLRTDGQLCRRNNMCTRGSECASGVCRKKVQPGNAGALCRKDRDCNFGHCCARENGQSVCKPLLQAGDVCTVPEGGQEFLWSHNCPCQNELRCMRLKTQQERSLSGRMKELLDDWSHAQERRCLPMEQVT